MRNLCEGFTAAVRYTLSDRRIDDVEDRRLRNDVEDILVLLRSARRAA